MSVEVFRLTWRQRLTALLTGFLKTEVRVPYTVVGRMARGHGEAVYGGRLVASNEAKEHYRRRCGELEAMLINVGQAFECHDDNCPVCGGYACHADDCKLAALLNDALLKGGG
jgi:hypothetical protein